MLKQRRKFVSLIAAVTMAIGLLPINSIKVNADINVGEKTTIQILATTDVHGKFKNYEYATISEAAGGMNQVAKVVSDARLENKNTLVIDNGDTIQGNYNHLFLTQEYLSNNTNPMVLSLNEIGYDSFTLGNHEFNYGMGILDTIVDQVENGGTSVLCANLYKDGQRVFSPYLIKEYDGVRVAVIGVVTNHITRWDAEKLVGYEPTNPALEVQKVISELKENNLADLYVVSAHVGLNEEYGDGDGATTIAELNPEISLIVAGHSHQTIESEIVNGVLITQPKNNGQGVAKVEIEVEKTEDGVNVVEKNVEHVSLSKTSEVDADLNNKLEEAHQIALSDANSVIGKLVGNNLAEENEIQGIPQSFVNDQGVTDLINEVQLYYSDKQLSDAGINTEDGYHVSGAAMLSASSNLYSGDISKAGLANIYKFDNKLYTIKTTGKQLKKYLEWSAQFYNTFNEGDLTISFDSSFASYKYDMLAGISYEINVSKEVGERIENLKFNDGKIVEDEDVVYLTVNDYRYSSNLVPLFDEGEHEKIYESTNDSLSDIRDMIADYIINVKGGAIERNVDNNWSLTGIKYNNDLRNEVIKLINDGTLTLEKSYGIVSTSLTFEEVERQLTEAGLSDKLEELRSLYEAKDEVEGEEEEEEKDPSEKPEIDVEDSEDKEESDTVVDEEKDEIIVDGENNNDINSDNENELPNTGDKVSFVVVLVSASAILALGALLLKEKNKVA